MNGHNYNDYKDCIEACLRCASLCQYCASMDLKGKDTDAGMSRCAQINTECAIVCMATAQLLSMGSDYAKDLCKVCIDICRECTVECEQHENEHCQACAEMCRHCADECAKM